MSEETPVDVAVQPVETAIPQDSIIFAMPHNDVSSVDQAAAAPVDESAPQQLDSSPMVDSGVPEESPAMESESLPQDQSSIIDSSSQQEPAAAVENDSPVPQDHTSTNDESIPLHETTASSEPSTTPPKKKKPTTTIEEPTASPALPEHNFDSEDNFSPTLSTDESSHHTTDMAEPTGTITTTTDTNNNNRPNKKPASTGTDSNAESDSTIDDTHTVVQPISPLETTSEPASTPADEPDDTLDLPENAVGVDLSKNPSSLFYHYARSKSMYYCQCVLSLLLFVLFNE